MKFSWLLFVCIFGHLRQHPLSSSEKAVVGNALTKALNVMSGKAPATSKASSCFALFPNRKPEKANDPVWESCKEIFHRQALLGHKQEPAEKAAEPAAEEKAAETAEPAAPGKVEVDKEGYEKDWQTEHRSEPFPNDTKHLQHHPDYESPVAIKSSSATSLVCTLLPALTLFLL